MFVPPNLETPLAWLPPVDALQVQAANYVFVAVLGVCYLHCSPKFAVLIHIYIGMDVGLSYEPLTGVQAVFQASVSVASGRLCSIPVALLICPPF